MTPNHTRTPLTTVLIEVIEKYGWIETLLELSSIAQIGIRYQEEEKFVEEIAQSLQQLVEGWSDDE